MGGQGKTENSFPTSGATKFQHPGERQCQGVSTQSPTEPTLLDTNSMLCLQHLASSELQCSDERD